MDGRGLTAFLMETRAKGKGKARLGGSDDWRPTTTTSQRQRKRGRDTYTPDSPLASIDRRRHQSAAPSYFHCHSFFSTLLLYHTLFSLLLDRTDTARNGLFRYLVLYSPRTHPVDDACSPPSPVAWRPPPTPQHPKWKCVWIKSHYRWRRSTSSRWRRICS